MFIECFKNNGTPYLRITQTYRTTEGGTPKTKRRVVRNIGPLSRFDDGKPEYLARLRESFSSGNPLIESLSDIAQGKVTAQKIVFEFDLANEDACYSQPVNVGYFLLDALYDGLGIYDVLNKHKSMTKIKYDLNGLAKILTFGRVLQPDSKIQTYGQSEKYVFPLVHSDNAIEVYRALDVLNEKSDAIQMRMDYKIKNAYGRNIELCYYDVTNYYFEIEQNDEDTVNNNGTVIREGTRKKGPSKEKRPEPIVQMGLFIDDMGLPIAYKLFPGNHVDQTTLRPALKESIDKLKYGRGIVVADGGLNSDKNIAHILSQKNGYILSRSTKKSAKCVRKWILEEDDYTWNEAHTFKSKSMIRQRTVIDENKQPHVITEKLVCFWSKKHYDREVRENQKFIEYLESVIKHPEKLKDKPRKIEKFLKKTEIEASSGEIIDTKTVLSIDETALSEYLDMLGYYTIMTSELDKSDREIIDKYHGLSRIEDSFRITKSDLEGRPVFVNTPEHINAHFLVCFIALTMIRLIQTKILRHMGVDESCENGWQSGLSAERIIKALSAYQVDRFPKDYYRFVKPSEDMKLILSALGIDGPNSFVTASELRAFKRRFDKALTM
jgi:transposase